VFARSDMSTLLKYCCVLVMILIGIIAFSVCAECPLDSCGQVYCGDADGSRPLGRVASRLFGALLSAGSMALMAFAVASPWFRSAVAALVRAPATMRTSSLRI